MSEDQKPGLADIAAGIIRDAADKAGLSSEYTAREKDEELVAYVLGFFHSLQLTGRYIHGGELQPFTYVDADGSVAPGKWVQFFCPDVIAQEIRKQVFRSQE